MILSYETKGKHMKQVNLKLVIAELEHLKDISVNYFARKSLEDAQDMIQEAMEENDVTYVSDITELALMISGNRFDYLTSAKFRELIQGASIGLCCTFSIFNRYLSESDFELWKNDKLDMSHMQGYDKGLCDVYLEASAYYKGWCAIERIFRNIQELDLMLFE